MYKKNERKNIDNDDNNNNDNNNNEMKQASTEKYNIRKSKRKKKLRCIKYQISVGFERWIVMSGLNYLSGLPVSLSSGRGRMKHKHTGLVDINIKETIHLNLITQGLFLSITIHYDNYKVVDFFS